MKNNVMNFLSTIVVASLIVGLLLSCKTKSTSENKLKSDETVMKFDGQLKSCVALRGNGDYIPSHFGALARIVETSGEVQAMAGGSSSTLTMFLYESMLRNPELANKSLKERSLKISLMLKSLLGVIDSFDPSLESSAFSIFHDLGEVISQKLPVNIAFTPMTNAEYERNKETLVDILSSPRHRKLLNRKIVAALRGESDLGFKNKNILSKELYSAASSFGKFKAESSSIFFRPSLINFDAFAEEIGLIGDMYAGLEPVSQAALKLFLDSCSDESIQFGKSWDSIKNKSAFGNGTCGRLFLSALKSYRGFLKADVNYKSRRLQEQVGKYFPAIAVTSVISGEAGMNAFKSAEAKYLNGQVAALTTDFERDVKVGHWISPIVRDRLLKSIAIRKLNSEDLKAKMFLEISETGTWGDVLSTSPAEPGLSAYRPLSKDSISLGGWPDLHPVQTLQSIDCKNIVYVTRRGVETPFIMPEVPSESDKPKKGIAELLGIDLNYRNGLFDIKKAESAFSKAVSSSTVWCSNWENIKSGQFQRLFDEAYDAEIALNAGPTGLQFDQTQKNMTQPIVGCKVP